MKRVSIMNKAKIIKMENDLILKTLKRKMMIKKTKILLIFKLKRNTKTSLISSKMVNIELFQVSSKLFCSFEKLKETLELYSEVLERILLLLFWNSTNFVKDSIHFTMERMERNNLLLME
jgi:hypothetical protein